MPRTLPTIVKKGNDVYRCPSDFSTDAAGVATSKYTSYGMNRYLGWTPDYDPDNLTDEKTGGICDDTVGSMHDYCGDLPYSVSKVATPASLVLIAEYGQLPAALSSDNERNFYNYIPGRAVLGGNFVSETFTYGLFPVTGTHTGGGNFAFCDGHVKYVNYPGYNTPWVPYDNLNPPQIWAQHWYPTVAGTM